MHRLNPYLQAYDFDRLIEVNSRLKDHITKNPKGETTINFSDSDAVYELNRALLLADFDLNDYLLPKGYLVPPVPGRLEYLLQLREFLESHSRKKLKPPLRGLDIGAGANGIYCILGAQHFNWQMIGSECDAQAVRIAEENIARTAGLADKIAIRHQQNKSALFKGIIQADAYFDFTVCNPPFHASAKEAIKGTLSKLSNLKNKAKSASVELNFQGQANELWCNGGEALFIKRLIKESVLFKDQVGVFSTLVAKSANLPKIEKQLSKTRAAFRVLPMQLGNKKSRIVVWWFD